MAARPDSIATTRTTSGRGAPSHTNTARPTKTERSAARRGQRRSSLTTTCRSRTRPRPIISTKTMYGRPTQNAAASRLHRRADVTDGDEWRVTAASTKRTRNAGSAAEATQSATCDPVSYTHLRAHETVLDLVCRL